MFCQWQSIFWVVWKYPTPLIPVCMFIKYTPWVKHFFSETAELHDKRTMQSLIGIFSHCLQRKKIWGLENTMTFIFSWKISQSSDHIIWQKNSAAVPSRQLSLMSSYYRNYPVLILQRLLSPSQMIVFSSKKPIWWSSRVESSESSQVKYVFQPTWFHCLFGLRISPIIQSIEWPPEVNARKAWFRIN